MALETIFPLPSCGIYSLPKTFIEHKDAIATDIGESGATTAEKVHQFVQTLLDVISLSQTAAVAACLTLFLTSFFVYVSSPSLISFFVTPPLFLTSFALGFIGYEVFVMRTDFQTFQGKLSEEYPTKTDHFWVDTKFFNQWENFTKDLQNHSYLISYFAKDALIQINQQIKQIAEETDKRKPTIFSTLWDSASPKVQKIYSWFFREKKQ